MQTTRHIFQIANDFKKRILTFAVIHRFLKSLITRYTYKAFGLIIDSEIECPELIPATGNPDISISLGNIPKSLNSPLFSGVRFQTSGKEFLLSVDGIARYYVKNGNSITIEKAINANLSDVRLFLLGSAIGAIIHQRGLIPFHGSSVKIGNEAIILSGLSGAGKSTLAVAFKQKGYQLLSDDISVISFNADGSPLTNPGFPYMKLWSDSILKLGDNPSNYSKIRGEIGKHRFPIKNSFWDKPLPLGKIFIISTSNLGDSKIEPIKGIEKFSMLKTHTYRFNFVVGAEMQTKHFNSFELLSKNVAVYRLIRPSGKFPFDELIDLVLGNNG
ncbi:MAG TPA: hypothetical protein DIW31_06930 [Bacteroidales bacterium]|nr:hypothetical protein [Bacteroidales bacterium]